MPRMRLGVIGAGSWANAAHLPALASHTSDLEFAAVSRHGQAQLDAVQRRWGFGVASEDYRDVLAAGVDLVIVSTPTALHHEQVLAALRAGAHVLCEKPMTLTSDEAWQLVDAAAETDRHLLVSFGWNFAPMVMRANELIQTHGLGDVENIMIMMSSQTRELFSQTGAYPDADTDVAPDTATWTDVALSGGGYGQAQLSHALALSLGLSGSRVESAFALMSSAGSKQVEMHDAIAIRLEGGGVCAIGGGSAYVGVDANRHHLSVEIIGSEGQLMVDLCRARATMFRPDTGQLDISVAPDDGAYNGRLPALALLDLAAGRRRDNPASGELGARTVEALELSYRSAASGQLEHRHAR